MTQCAERPPSPLRGRIASLLTSPSRQRRAPGWRGHGGQRAAACPGVVNRRTWDQHPNFAGAGRQLGRAWGLIFQVLW